MHCNHGRAREGTGVPEELICKILKINIGGGGIIYLVNSGTEIREQRTEIGEQGAGVRKAPARSTASIVQDREVILCKEGLQSAAVCAVSVR